MRIFELDQIDPRATALAAVTDQLKSDLDAGDISPEMSLEELLKYLRKYDISLSNQDLYNMIKRPPLNKLISNIKGDQVIFKGYDLGVSAPVDQQKKVVQQMAKRAIK
jgi:hypothetical protein